MYAGLQKTGPVTLSPFASLKGKLREGSPRGRPGDASLRLSMTAFGLIGALLQYWINYHKRKSGAPERRRRFSAERAESAEGLELIAVGGGGCYADGTDG